MNIAAFQQRWDDMAEPDDGMDDLAAAAGMDTDEFRAECERRNEIAKQDVLAESHPEIFFSNGLY